MQRGIICYACAALTLRPLLLTRVDERNAGAVVYIAANFCLFPSFFRGLANPAKSFQKRIVKEVPEGYATVLATWKKNSITNNKKKTK